MNWEKVVVRGSIISCEWPLKSEILEVALNPVDPTTLNDGDEVLIKVKCHPNLHRSKVVYVFPRKEPEKKEEDIYATDPFNKVCIRLDRMEKQINKLEYDFVRLYSK